MVAKPTTSGKDELERLESLFKGLADETRLRILSLLLAGDACVCEIQQSLRLPQPKVSRHLARLRRAGLVRTSKDGLWVHYGLAEPSDEVVEALLIFLRQCLGHLPTAARDQRRLAAKPRCCAQHAAGGRA